MLDIDALSVAIKAKIDAASSTLLIHNKSSYGYIAEGTARPKCRYQVIAGDDIQGAFGHKLINSVPVQFDVFADELSTANSLQKALATLFHGTSLSLSSGTHLGSRVVPGNVTLVEGQLPTPGLVYHSVVRVIFAVQGN